MNLAVSPALLRTTHHKRVRRSSDRPPSLASERARCVASAMQQNLFRFTVLLVCAAYCSTLQSQVPEPRPPQISPDPRRPPLTPLHSEGDWSFLEDAANRVDPLDRLKYIRLSSKTFLTLGAEYRLEHEWFDNHLWGEGPQDGSGYLLQRLMPHLNLTAGSRLRAFASLKFNQVSGRNGGPRPGIDRDLADLHEAFLGTSLRSARKVVLRVGRQELLFGSGRLTANNEGVNVRFSFDAVRLTFQRERWRADVFASRPSTPMPGAWDNKPDHQQAFWGLYGTAPASRNLSWDLYYFGLDRKQSIYQSRFGREIRHSIGTRVHGRSEATDYDWEAVYQFGSFEGSGIGAWTVASETGHTLRSARYRPRIALKADAASGDRNPADRRLNTFNPLFPKGGYFARMVLAGPLNFIDVHPLVQLELRPNITAQVDWDWFWRQSTRDGLYGIGGFQIRSGTGSNARYIGSQGNLETKWALNPHLTLQLSVSGFLTGRYLQDVGLGKDVVYVNYGFTYRF
jgi:hypothetical protein